MIDNTGKLTPEGKQQINNALRELNKAVELVRRKAACGEDCQKHMDDISGLMASLTAYKEQFAKGV